MPHRPASYLSRQQNTRADVIRDDHSKGVEDQAGSHHKDPPRGLSKVVQVAHADRREGDDTAEANAEGGGAPPRSDLRAAGLVQPDEADDQVRPHPVQVQEFDERRAGSMRSRREAGEWHAVMALRGRTREAIGEVGDRRGTG